MREDLAGRNRLEQTQSFSWFIQEATGKSPSPYLLVSQ
jgi:hypothetical protein